MRKLTTLALGDALHHAVHDPDPSLQGLDIALLEEAFLQAVLAECKTREARENIEAVAADPDLRRAWLAKSATLCHRYFQLYLSVQRAEAQQAKAEALALLRAA